MNLREILQRREAIRTDLRSILDKHVDGALPDEVRTRADELEAEAGRLRSVPNAARTLDLDIIAMGDGGQMVRAVPDPVLPHPRAHLRAFVLVPLLDVAPNWVHPVLRRPAAGLLAALPPQDVAVLD